MEVIFIKKDFGTLADAKQTSQVIHGSIVFDSRHGALFVDGKIYGNAHTKEVVKYIPTHGTSIFRFGGFREVQIEHPSYHRPEPVAKSRVSRCVSNVYRSCVIGE